MNIKQYKYLVLIILFSNCQQTERKVLKNEMFGWNLTLPENFYSINQDKWVDLKKSAEEIIVKDRDLKITDKSETIFVVENGEFNRFEANYTLTENFIAPNSTFENSMRIINIVLYDNFKIKALGAKIDSLTTFETIDSLKFMKFEMNTKFDDGLTIKSKSYKRQFKDTT